MTVLGLPYFETATRCHTKRGALYHWLMVFNSSRDRVGNERHIEVRHTAERDFAKHHMYFNATTGGEMRGATAITACILVLFATVTGILWIKYLT